MRYLTRITFLTASFFIPLLSSPLFAASFDALAGKHFEGQGDWQKPDGSSGTFHSTMDVTQTDKLTFQIKDAEANAEGQGLTVTWTARFKDESYRTFVMEEDGKNTGYGFCFPNYCKIHHLDATHDAHKFLSFGTGFVHKMGEKPLGGNDYYGWQTDLKEVVLP